MRRLGLVLLAGLFLTIPAAAQRGGGGHGGMGGGFHGGMGGGFHGGGFGGSGFHSGYNRFNGGFRYFRGGYFPRNRYIYGLGYYPWGYRAGWGYPYYGYPYYGYPYYDYSYSSSPSSYYSYPSSASSPVVIYQSQPPAVVYEVPQQTEIPAATYSPQGDGKTIYLIALKGQENICAAQAYWVTQKTLHFITLDGEARQVPIESVDRALTFNLNRDRNVDFQLPIGK